MVEAVEAQTCYGIAGNSLIHFDAAAPGVILSTQAMTGIMAGMEVAGLDFRPATGELYAMGYTQTTGMAQLYVIDPATAAATAIGAGPVMLKANMGKVSMDFNPTVDRIRVVGSDNSNFRMHPVTGAVVATDGALAFAAGDPNASQNPSIGAVAYTNSYIGATATTLINFDDSLNVFCTQIPPNNGTLNTLGGAGIVVNLVSPATDFDIYFDAATGTNTGFFTANLSTAANLSALFRVNLSSGQTTLVGNIGIGVLVQDIACQIAAPPATPAMGPLAVALNASGHLITFDTEAPEMVRSQVGVSGLTTGQVLVGMDFRPATRELVGLGYDAATKNSQLYTINYTTGVVTAINTVPFMLELGTGAAVGFDFNPTVDRIRVVAANNMNYRLNPVTGTIAATDMALSYAAGDVNAGANPAIAAAAYTQSFSGATTTTLYVYDDSLNTLCTQIPPNDGKLNTLGNSTIVLNLSDATLDLDIFYDLTTMVNTAYAVANPAGATADFLYEVNLTTGVFTLLGKIGQGIAVRDLAIVPDAATTSIGRADLPDAGLVVSPNPTQDLMTLAFDLISSGQTHLVMTDMMGRVVMQSPGQYLTPGHHESTLSAHAYPAGMYIVSVVVEGIVRGSTRVHIQRP
ncbi:MAG: DUF4394 domain-containing protein [Bacteroidia bacterium]|nr:DUF4394 domain-containing protein [Bacteroidia bacterium]